MTNPFNTPTASNFGLFLARGTLGVYFAATGYRGVMEGVANFARSHVKYMPAWVTPQYGEVFLALYPVVQLACGVLLAIGVLTRLSSFLLASTLLVFMVCVTGIRLGESNPVQENMIVLAVTIALLTNGGGNMTLPALLGKKGGGGAPKAGAAPAPAK